MWVEIQELNDAGDYSPVEVIPRADIQTGGVYQLRQGQQRRVLVEVRPVHNSGTLPIICQSIINIAVGSVSKRFGFFLLSFVCFDVSFVSLLM